MCSCVKSICECLAQRAPCSARVSAHPRQLLREPCHGLQGKGGAGTRPLLPGKCEITPIPRGIPAKLHQTSAVPAINDCKIWRGRPDTCQGTAPCFYKPTLLLSSFFPPSGWCYVYQNKGMLFHFFALFGFNKARRLP